MVDALFEAHSLSPTQHPAFYEQLTAVRRDLRKCIKPQAFVIHMFNVVVKCFNQQSEFPRRLCMWFPSGFLTPEFVLLNIPGAFKLL
jgi:hypothetical protein